jgi:hypothetical protein
MEPLKATCERRILRWMFGGIKVNENWRKRYNKETSCCVIITQTVRVGNISSI